MNKVPVKALKALAKFINVKDIRYYLNGIYVDKDGYLVATDGHRIMTYITEIECDSSYIIPIDSIKQVIKLAVSKKHMEDIVLLKGSELVYARNGYEIAKIAFTPVDGTFPDWKRVIRLAYPEYDDTYEQSTCTTSINIKYLYDTHMAYKYLTGLTDDSLHLSITVGNATTPWRVVCKEVPEAKMYVMGKRNL
jgi:DNA polymerase III sliding clamp (beta) subunit (PCNA family)